MAAGLLGAADGESDALPGARHRGDVEVPGPRVAGRPHGSRSFRAQRAGSAGRGSRRVRASRPGRVLTRQRADSNHQPRYDAQFSRHRSADAFRARKSLPECCAS